MPDTTSPAFTARLKRQWMALFSYLMFLPVLIVCVEQGWVDFGYRGLAAFTAAGVGNNLAFHLALRSGVTQGLRDPSLLVPQLTVATVLALLMGYFAREALPVVLALFFTAYFFGVFSLRMREYFALAVFAAVGYAAMLGLKYPPALRMGETFRIELLHYGLLVMVLMWMALLGSYVSRLRTRLEDKRNALAGALERLQTLASHDELTGVLNRRRLMEVLEQQRERATRHGEAFSIALFDLDHFKQLNDRLGHQAGDTALRAFSAHVESGVRCMDVLGRAEPRAPGVFGRYGGEEFLLVLPHTALDEAAHCVERLRRSMHDGPASGVTDAPALTFSAGVAQYRLGETAAQLLHRADLALYRAKHDGRDRVGIAP